MNLTASQLKELNGRLRSEDLGFPDIRKEVTSSGANYAWVRKALSRSGKGSKELRDLLGL